MIKRTITIINYYITVISYNFVIVMLKKSKNIAVVRSIYFLRTVNNEGLFCGP